MRVAAVVVNWNGGEENLACLESLLDQTPAPARVWFLDNASRDGSAELVEARFPAVRVVRNAENLGYGGANNRGIDLALADGADAVFVVNNDVVVPPGQLALLMDALERNPGVGVVGPRVLYAQDPTRVWAAGGMLTYRQNLTTLLGHGAPDGPRWRADAEVSYVPGCAMLVRREVFERVGRFDEAFFMYTEDVDFCLRAACAGWRSRVVGEARALHAASTSTGGGYNPRRKYMMGVNSVWFLRRWAGPGQWARFLVFDVGTLPFLWLAGLFRGRSKSVVAKAVGIWHGLLGRRVTAASVELESWLW